MPTLTESEIQEIVRTYPPREIPESRLRALGLRRGARVGLLLIGLFLLLFSIPFLWIFFPWHIVDSLRLDLGSPLVASGRVTGVESTNMDLNGATVHEVRFEFTPEGGESISGRSWTTAPPHVGSEVEIEYLGSHGSVARATGTALDPFGYVGSFVILFTIIGLALFLAGLRRTPRALWLLENGEAIDGEVIRVTQHGAFGPGDRTPGSPSLEIRVRYSPWGQEHETTMWIPSRRAVVERGRFTVGQRLSVLHDPNRPKRATVLECL